MNYFLKIYNVGFDFPIELKVNKDVFLFYYDRISCQYDVTIDVVLKGDFKRIIYYYVTDYDVVIPFGFTEEFSSKMFDK